MRSLPWVGIEPGDVGFDGGTGFFGWIIRRATGVVGHTWVYHQYLGDGAWETVEAGPRGVRRRVRTRPAVKVVRLWRNQDEQVGILAASSACVGAKYGWGEIVRLALHTIGVRVRGWSDSPDRMICSNHVARSLTGGVPSLGMTLPYPPPHIWPQRLAEWCDWVLWTRDRARGV